MTKYKIGPRLFRFLPFTPSIVCGAWELLHCHQGQRASFHNQIFPNQVTNLARCISVLSERKNTVYPQLQRKMVSTLRVISHHSRAKMYQALPPELEAVGQDHIIHIKMQLTGRKMLAKWWTCSVPRLVYHHCTPTILVNVGGKLEEASKIVSIGSVQWKQVCTECYRSLLRHKAKLLGFPRDSRA